MGTRLRRTCGLAALTSFALAVTLLESRGPRPAAADLVLLSGKVITVDDQDRIVQAVAIADGRIVAVGSNDEVKALIDERTERLDLTGLTVTPGLLDAHAHFSGGGGDRLFVLDLAYPNVKTIADVAMKVRDSAAKLPAGAWVEGRGWDEGKLDERRLIVARDLDAVSADRPVYLTQTTGHYGVANSVALKLAGITRETADPPGGTIDRYPDGTPTGVLKEGAQNLVRRLIPPRSPQQVERGIRELAKAFNAEGMTGVKDPGISSAVWDAYSRVLADGGLTVRVFALWSGGRAIEGAKDLIVRRAAMTRPYVSTGDDHLIAGGVKLYIDGSGGARTGWLYDEWNRDHTATDTGNRGYPTSDPETIRTLIRMYHDAGLHVGVHAIGDRAIDWVVDSYAEALKAKPTKGLRHSIIHANIPSDHAIAVMTDLQKASDAGYPEPSASFTWWLGDTYAANFGPQRSLRLNPFHTYRANGLIWGNGSDFDVTPFPARYGIWSAVARQTLLKVHGPDPFGRRESVDVRTALRAVTIWAARQMFLERKIGSIEVGKHADLAVWDRDLYTAPLDQIKEMTCRLTIFNGRIVYQAPAGAVVPRQLLTYTRSRR